MWFSSNISVCFVQVVALVHLKDPICPLLTKFMGGVNITIMKLHMSLSSSREIIGSRTGSKCVVILENNNLGLGAMVTPMIGARGKSCI